MINFQIIRANEYEQWDSIVKSFSKYDVNYLCWYAKAFQLHGDGEPFLFYYKDEKTRAINVFMKRDISNDERLINKVPLNTWFDISTPYGYGGFLIEGNGYEAVNEAYYHYCRDQGFICEFVRFHLINNYQSYYYGVSETHTHNVIRSLDMSIDEIQKDYEHKVRKNLKKANKEGLKVEFDTSGARLNEFLEIYYGTIERNSAKSNYFFSEDFFKTINRLSGNYIYVHILYEGKVISTELVIYGSENCYSFLGGTNKDYFVLRPNDFLKHEIIKWAKEKGLKRFILGGGAGEDDGIFKYKRSFSPSGLYDFYTGKKIFDEGKYKDLIEIRSKDYDFNTKTTYFPAYRS